MPRPVDAPVVARARVARGAVALLALILSGDGLAAQSTARPPSPPVVAKRSADSTWRWAKVTYLSGESIYLDAGTLAGLREKSVVELLRGDTVAVVLEVQFVASARAAARITRGTGVAIGDSVRFRPVRDAAIVASIDAARATAAGDTRVADSTASARPATPRRSSPRVVSGRIGLRYLSLQTGAGAAGVSRSPRWMSAWKAIASAARRSE